MGRFMNHKKWVVALALIATALILTHLPVSEADAAASASDFQIEGSTLTNTEEAMNVSRFPIQWKSWVRVLLKITRRYSLLWFPSR